MFDGMIKKRSLSGDSAAAWEIQDIFLVYEFSVAPLLFKIGTFCVPTEVESGFGILSQNWDCPA